MTTAKEETPDIYSYHDYRAFLKDWLQHLKHTQGVSTRQVALKSEVSESYLSMVLKGTRRLSFDQLSKLVEALQLGKSEASYFEWLIQIKDADEPGQQHEALVKIQRFRRYRSLNPLEVETYRFLQHWYHVAIRELARLPDFQLDPKWIQQALCYKVSIPEIKTAIEFLSECGFLKVDPKGQFSKPEKLIECKTGVLKPALIKFHGEMLHLATMALTEIPSEMRNISGFTASINQNQMDEIKKILEEAREKIISVTRDGTPADSVYHFGFLAIPMGQNNRGDSHDS